MIHFGDIKDMTGENTPTVDVVIGGSPCQDLSVAGKRAGLSGERSGLFMEQIRIIKELREHDRAMGRADELLRPRFMVWENVPGSLSSPGKGHSGEDFQAVLHEICKIIRKTERTCTYAKGKQTPCEDCNAGCPVRYLWESGVYGSTPHRQESDEQRSAELGALVQELSRQTAPREVFLRCLRRSSERSSSMQQALASLEKE